MNYRTHILEALRDRMPIYPVGLEQGKRLAEQTAAMLLALHSVTRPAVDVRNLARFPGVVITTVPDLAVPSMAEFADGQWFIAIRGKDHLTRRRFSVAREFWQVLVDSRPIFDTDGATARTWMRLCADHFAASLLMPEAWVCDTWVRGVREVSYLAGYFLVSREAMTRRLRDLGLSDTLVRQARSAQSSTKQSSTTSRGRRLCPAAA